MVLSEMMPNRQGRDCDLADFGIQNIDRDHDWINESRLQYSEIEEAESFIQQEISDSDAVQARNNLENIDLRTLNEKQKLAFKRIELHYIITISNQSVEPL